MQNKTDILIYIPLFILIYGATLLYLNAYNTSLNPPAHVSGEEDERNVICEPLEGIEVCEVLPEGERRTASISWYSRADSCHNPEGDKCLTAAGTDTVDGRTVACPRDIPLGTRVYIGGVGSRICDDRYARWIDELHGQTFDIFTESQEEALQKGRQEKEVVILD